MKPIYRKQAESRDWGDVPPPPGSAPTEGRDSSKRSQRYVRPRPKTYAFDAEIDCGELDDRDRPTAAWIARARELSRSSIVFSSRRMCYHGRLIVFAIHLIDDEPVALFGRVHTCEYEADGLYRVDVDLLPLPDHRVIRDWVELRSRQKAASRNA